VLLLLLAPPSLQSLLSPPLQQARFSLLSLMLLVLVLVLVLVLLLLLLLLRLLPKLSLLLLLISWCECWFLLFCPFQCHS
jgi:hypothetical protein